MKKLLLITAALAFAAGSASAQNLLTNADFADISDPASGWEAFVGGNVQPSTVVSVSSGVATLAPTAATETNFYQSFLDAQGDALAPGTYEFSSDISNITTDGSDVVFFVKVFDAGWGFQGGEFQNPAAVEGTNTLSFTVDGSFPIYQVGWYITGSTTGGMDITNPSLTLVPEPSTYAAILGLLAIGFVAWRRRR